MERRLALVRATHLCDYISVLRDIGAPVDRDLARSKLPGHIEETPELYVSVPAAMEWIAQTGHDLEPMELGLIAAGRASLASLPPVRQAALATAQTGLKRLEALAALSRSEDSALEMSIRREGSDFRVHCNMAGLDRHPFVCLAEWLNLQAIISVVRSVVGPFWHPKEMCFVTSGRLPRAVSSSFPNTRILLDQLHTSIVIESIYLAKPTNTFGAPEPDQTSAMALEKDLQDGSGSWGFVYLLRKMIQPYLGEGSPAVAFAAEMAGISTRTLQRRLTQSGSSYTQILQEARFELACMRLNDPGLKVIDVAMMAGYESPQHFTRAFRRFTGATPTVYRQHCFEKPL